MYCIGPVSVTRRRIGRFYCQIEARCAKAEFQILLNREENNEEGDNAEISLEFPKI